MKVVYAGTPDFAVPPLHALVQAGHDVCRVYTQPDRPAGRGRKTAPSPVKKAAESLGLPLRQPASLRGDETQSSLRSLGADVMVVVAYGLILPPAVLDIPRMGCINIHASLLPRWRGAAPIQRAILAGDSQTGVSLMRMDSGLDTGPVLTTATLSLRGDETAQTVHDALAKLGAEALPDCLTGLADGSLRAEPQPAEGSTYAPKLDKQEARVDWTQEAATIHRAIRAFNPWPVAHSPLDGEVTRIWSARLGPAKLHHGAPGEIIAATDEGLIVACGNGALTITELQFPGKRRMAAGEAARGRALAGKRFSSLET